MPVQSENWLAIDPQNFSKNAQVLQKKAMNSSGNVHARLLPQESRLPLQTSVPGRQPGKITLWTYFSVTVKALNKAGEQKRSKQYFK